jgi:hypothetical protein
MSKTFKYIKWSAINSWSTSTLSVFSSSSMISIISQNPNSSLLSINYIGKDIIGQLSSMIFLWKNSKNFDKYCSVKYVTYASIIQQVGFILEYNSFFISDDKYYVLPFLGFCNVLKNISFIMIGATNAKSIKNISSKNIGEIYMKVTTTNTIASTFGLVSGIFILNIVPHKYISSLIIPSLTFLSVYSIRKATQIANK